MRKKLLLFFALLLVAATGAWAQADMKKTPLTLKAKTGGTIVVENPPVGMKYSKNGGDKTAVTSEPITVAIDDEVQFFGDGTSIASYGNSFTHITNGTADCYIYGNIMSLVDEYGYATATELTDDIAFVSLFSYNSHLYNHDTYELVLPATTLTNYCYQDMFNGCTNLTKAPALPATTLASSCYSTMFFGCTNLTTAPALPATTLASYCYQRMFQGCTNLTTAPELPATTLASSCYRNMFNGCTKLNSVTCLATNISAGLALDNWLSGVAATGTFTKAEGMTSWELNSASGIPAGWTVAVPDMKETPLTLQAMTAETIVVSSPKSGMQYSKNGGAKTELTADAGYNSSYGVWTITVAAGDKVQFFGNGTSIVSYYGTRISGGGADCYIYGNIMSLVDETGFATATTLTGANAFGSLFSGNSHLYNHHTYKLVLPATTLATGCYYSMFAGCTNLTTAPELPATTLPTGCYYYMFSGCSNLNSVTCLATDISASYALGYWLDGVAATGTFTKASTADWGDPGANTIPSGWTVANKAILNDANDIASQLTAGQECTVEYSREFTESKPSTVCLPFDYEVKTGEKFYTFTGVEKEGDEYVATMTEHTGATLAANTPYLYKSATTGDTDFSGTYTIPATISAAETTSGDWKFVGTYDTQSWTTAPTGIYGFSAQDVGGISQGEFVKVGAYVKVKPMRAYLKYKNGAENYAGVRALSGSAAGEALPERIKVRLIGADGEVTGIGMLETQTGEVSFDPEAWYTLDGKRLSGKPTEKGIYVNNGKKVIVK